MSENNTYEVQDFKKEVIEQSESVPVLVDFWAPWCGPCKALSPLLEEFAGKSEDKWKLVKVNVDNHQDLASQFGVRGIPMVLLFKKGKSVDGFSGAVPRTWFENWLAKQIPSDNDLKVEEATKLYESGDHDAAQQILEGILANEPGHTKARIALAEMLLFSESAKAHELAENIFEDNEDFQKADSIKAISGLLMLKNSPDKLEEENVKPVFLKALDSLSKKDYDKALEHFIEVIVQNKPYHNEAARKACVAIFNLLGREHEITKKHRRKFDMSLY